MITIKCQTTEINFPHLIFATTNKKVKQCPFWATTLSSCLVAWLLLCVALWLEKTMKIIALNVSLDENKFLLKDIELFWVGIINRV